MYAEESILDILFMMLYGGAAMLTLVPLTVAVLLRMLQDRRRRLWPWLVAELPVVAVAIVGIATHDERAMHWMNGWQTVVIVAFIARYFFALRDYNRWLEQNFADLEHKDIWRSLLVAGGLGAVYEMYCVNPGLMPVEYLSQVFTIIIAVFIVWRVETLQTLATESSELSDSPEPSVVRPLAASPLDFGPQLRDRCEATGLYLQHDLTLAQLADVLSTNRTYLSAYFAQTGTTYNAYINQLRIAHFERRCAEAMAAPDDTSVTAKDLAAECGFSSYSTFSAAFKKHRGITVRDWMRQ